MCNSGADVVKWRRRKKAEKRLKRKELADVKKIDEITKLELKKDANRLLEFLRDKDARVRWYAARGILRILVHDVQNKKVDERIVNALAEVLRKDKDFETRIKAAKALAYCFYSKNAERALLDALKDERREVAIEAACSLGELISRKVRRKPIENLKLRALLKIIGRLMERGIRLPLGGFDLLVYSFLYGSFKRYCPRSDRDIKRVMYVEKIANSLKDVEDIREIAKILNLL